MDQPAYLLHRGDALTAYGSWPAPAVIISDGAYGIRGFHRDTTGVGELADWYRPHVAAWSRHASPATTLWFWNTEVGWATVHPLLVASGSEYLQVITWDKGVAHIAGNVNGKTIRRFPVATEVCAFYQRRFEVRGAGGQRLELRLRLDPSLGLSRMIGLRNRVDPRWRPGPRRHVPDRSWPSTRPEQ